MSDLLVILGAGASYDAYESDPCPPLTDKLFDEDHHAGFSRFENVEGLRGTILSRVKRGSTLETVLREFNENPQEDIRRQVFDLPIYLKNLLAQFDGRAASRYDDLITLIQERGISVTFVTLNYDMLLDSAIERKYDTTISSFDRYTSATESWQYVKFHGSVNWGYRTSIPSPEHTLDGSRVGDYLRILHNYGTPFDYDRSRLELLEFPQWWQSGDALIYPALALPTDQKGPFVCPTDHVEVLRETLRSDPAVLVIGNQGLDTALMDILRESAQRGTSKALHIVDYGNGNDVTSRFQEALMRTGFFRLKDTLDEVFGTLDSPDIGESPITWSDAGFGLFVESGDAERFFDAVVAALN